jgi:uncharacterized protein
MIDMRHLMSMTLVTVLACASFSAIAFDPAIPSHGLPSASDYSATLLPELQGVVSWRTLGQVEPIKRNGKMVPSFSNEILALDKKLVRVYGFMMPLDMTDQQKHFLLSAVPPSCPFCMPAGPEAIVEVMSKRPVKYAFEPIIMAGKLSLLTNDQSGMLYRMLDAEPVDTEVK